MPPRLPSVWERLGRRDPRHVLFGRTVPPRLAAHIGPPPFVRRLARGDLWPPVARRPALPAPPSDATGTEAD